MMIWDFIRDFFVQYIFGGITSDGQLYGGFFGQVISSTEQSSAGANTGNIGFGIGSVYNGDDDAIYNMISMGDWLSTTATIIVMCLIVFLLICLVRWIFRAVSSAMLLK